ncbi:hypothetical protein ACV338_30585, partial [Pseudomonas aeruginosa]
IKVGITALGGGAGATDFGAPANLALGALVLLSIVLLNRSRLPWLRLAAIVIGLALGTLAAWRSQGRRERFSRTMLSSTSAPSARLAGAPKSV